MTQPLTSVHVREDLPPVSAELLWRVSSLTPSWQTHCVQVASLAEAAVLLDVLNTYDRAQELGVDHFVERWDGSAWVESVWDEDEEINTVLEAVEVELMAAHRRFRRPPSRWSRPCPENVSGEELDERMAVRFAAENPDLNLDSVLDAGQTEDEEDYAEHDDFCECGDCLAELEHQLTTDAVPAAGGVASS